MATPVIPEVKYLTSTPMCGFCTWPSAGADHGPDAAIINGNHCTIGIEQKGGTEILRCGCPCSHDLIKCLDCGKREREYAEDHEVNPTTWRCFDTEACRAAVEKRLDDDPTIRMIRAAYARADERRRLNSGERRDRTADTGGRTTSRKCLCCGEATKGGLFLPGHDSRYLSRTVEDIQTGVVTLDATLNAWTKRGLSEALQAKLVKRVTA